MTLFHPRAVNPESSPVPVRPPCLRLGGSGPRPAPQVPRRRRRLRRLGVGLCRPRRRRWPYLRLHHPALRLRSNTRRRLTAAVAASGGCRWHGLPWRPAVFLLPLPSGRGQQDISPITITISTPTRPRRLALCQRPLVGRLVPSRRTLAAEAAFAWRSLRLHGMFVPCRALCRSRAGLVLLLGAPAPPRRRRRLIGAGDTASSATSAMVPRLAVCRSSPPRLPMSLVSRRGRIAAGPGLVASCCGGAVPQHHHRGRSAAISCYAAGRAAPRSTRASAPRLGRAGRLCWSASCSCSISAHRPRPAPSAASRSACVPAVSLVCQPPASAAPTSPGSPRPCASKGEPRVRLALFPPAVHRQQLIPVP